ncbi:FHF complex subunit HOOK interacting protein 1B isoform X1 [Clupea harengus]|uniref:FHF complex subunit HOOK-interacting protein 1B n=1 Tax=Clupea harengus TaxID=7950 RepID=A0A6P3WG72_CLUHA|nr:FHF complex subunit HOOK interacting protein 1B isoform X1 [Clupea harengus]
MSWLSRLTPRGTGSRSGRNAAPASPCTADPETCLMVFQNHWRQVSWVLEQKDPVSGGADDLTAVRNHTDQMLCLLAEERPQELDSSEGLSSSSSSSASASMGPILDFVVSERVLERLVEWHVRRGLDPDSQGALLKLFEMLIGQSQQPLLQHTAVLQPLFCLLATCADPQLGCPPALEASLVLLLNQVCVCMAREPRVLELLFQAAPAPQGPTNLLIFSLLVPFIHRHGALGQQARDALLLVMATSASNQAVAQYITENSYFCPVLATGLSALYSSLPRKIEVRGDDWHALRREDWMGVSSLVLFMNSLEFCNAVVQVAHPLVRSQLLDYVHNGFLVPVMGPALHKSSVDEMIASTAYLDLFLRSVTETSLLKTFLQFILVHRHDNDTILDTLLTRISSNSRLCMVSLSLFKTLLSLNCEDLMLQLVLRYLLPCTHVMLSQRRAVRETDIYGKSADKFLSLIPECCHVSTAPSSDREEEPAFWGKVLGSPSSESPVHPRPSTPSRLALFMRQQSTGGGSASSPSSADPTPSSPRGGPAAPLSPDSPLHQGSGTTDVPDGEMGYLDYLRDARRGIELCSWACRDWSAPYDGEDPSPNLAPLPPPPPTSHPSLNLVPEHFSLQGGSTPGASAGTGASTGLGPGSGEAGQKERAAVVEAARSEWTSSERDSGEWDVTISKNCISLTPRSKKRSLQRDQMPLNTAPLHLSSSSSSSSSSATTMPTSTVPTSDPAAPHQALFNGTGRGDSCPDVSDGGMEVKKVKRDVDASSSGGDLGQNGTVGMCTLEACPPLQGGCGGDVRAGAGTLQQTLPQVSRQPQPAGPPLSCPVPESQPDEGSKPTPSPAPVPEASSASNRGLQSVESLIEELLERAPVAVPQAGDSNGQGISIEAFHQELRELEERLRGRRAAGQALEELNRDVPILEQTEDEPQPPPTPLETESGVGEAKMENAAEGLFSPARPLGQPAAPPYTGPFIMVLFAKLENMLQNSLYVNILLTGMVFQLACYPQPLIRSFLLNANMVFQPSVKSLIQVLGTVKNRIEVFAAMHEDFPAMLTKARRYLLARGKLDWSDSPTSLPGLRRSDSMGEVKSRKPSLGDLILRHTNSPTRARHAAQLAYAHVRDGGQSLHSALFRGATPSSSASGLERQAEALRVKNAVYCAVVFSEFLKELAALAQEHAVALPFPRSSPGAEE